METIYYSLDARRLTACGTAGDRKASGGTETVCYAFVPRRRPASSGGDKVVAFPARPGAPAQPPVPARPPRAWRKNLALIADLCASAAVVVLAAAIAVRFFAL